MLEAMAKACKLTYDPHDLSVAYSLTRSTTTTRSTATEFKWPDSKAFKDYFPDLAAGQKVVLALLSNVIPYGLGAVPKEGPIEDMGDAFAVTPSLWHIIVVVWKHVCSVVAQELAIVMGKRGIKMLLKMQKLRRIDFSALQILPLDWNYQEEVKEETGWIRQQRRILQDTCLMDTEAVQRFCGSR